VSYEELQPKYHSGERDPNAISEKSTEGEEVLDMRLAARLEAVNQRLTALSAKHAVVLGTEAISQGTTALKAIRTEDMDPDSTESEEPLPARPDTWPGDDKRAGEVRGHGNAALFAQLHGICVEHGPVEEVLWAEAEREEVRGGGPAAPAGLCRADGVANIQELGKTRSDTSRRPGYAPGHGRGKGERPQVLLPVDGTVSHSVGHSREKVICLAAPPRG